MPAFVYRACDTGGQISQGRADAESETELVGRLRNQGLFVLGVQRDRDIQVALQEQRSLFNPKVKTKDLTIFARQFATMINAGLPIVTALKVLARQANNKRLREALYEVAADVEAGETLSAAFATKSCFPNLMVQMISAGEVGGILDDVFARMATQLEKDETIRQKVKSALMYPSVVGSIAIVVVVLLVMFVVPRFVDVYADFGATLPAPTRLLIWLSWLFGSYWWALAGVVAAAVFGVRYWLHTEHGANSWDRWALRLPIMGPMVSKQAIARFARTLGGLLSSGIAILKALAVTEKTVGNRVVAAAIRDALEEVRQGQTLVVPMRRSGVFPPMVQEMVSVGEETGTLEQMLDKVAVFYEEEVERSAERLSATLEPIIIVFLAGSAGLIVAAMMLPIFSLWSQF